MVVAESRKLSRPEKHIGITTAGTGGAFVAGDVTGQTGAPRARTGRQVCPAACTAVQVQ